MKTIFRRFCKRKASVLGLIVLILFVLVALVGPSLCRQDPMAINAGQIHKPPSAQHWFGTDYLGRDTLTRLVYGARISLALSVSAVLSGSLIGVLLGVCAGYFGKRVDAIISRVIDILLAFPNLLLAMLVVAILGQGLFNTAMAIAISSVPSVARMVRGVVISLRSSQYISASRVMGESNTRIIFTHIIPNSVSQIIVNTTLNLGTAILSASSLSFLGLGVQPPNPEWGQMLSLARTALRLNPSEALFPGIAITLVVMSFSLVGDGLRDALDPKLKNVS
ncbi:ABC transporter permease [Ruminococcaceae bacterium OttesenSCG-928-O06]|nr:ABC transporter permease [Ruminococcaceae bacterium OttesenSCG-928-O06]